MGRSLQNIAVAAVAALALAACDAPETEYTGPYSAGDTGPDEFNVLPVKPLEAPEDFDALPEPTPGGVNRTDPTPKADAVAAFGGRLRGEDGAVPAADSALIAHVARFGTDPAIRQTLKAEDEERIRRGRRLLTGFIGGTSERAYRGQVLDPYAELERFRALGVRTPSAPPAR